RPEAPRPPAAAPPPASRRRTSQWAGRPEARRSSRARSTPRSGWRDRARRSRPCAGVRPLPAEPVDDGAAHHPLEVAALQPRQLLGEHRHALTVRARHAGDVRAPERAVGPERLEDLAQVAVDALVGIGLARVARSARHLDPDVGVLREREHVLEIGEGRVVGHAGAATVTSEVVDVELQARMRSAIFASAAICPPARSPTGKAFPLARPPEPVERPVGPPGLLLRLVEGEPEPEHARPLAPARDDLLAIRAEQVEVAQDAELARG